MKRLFSTVAHLGIGLAMTVAGLVADSPKAEAAEPIKVGIVTFLTGGGAGTTGIPARDAADMIIREINAGKLPAPYNTPGFGGRSIEAVNVDEAGGNTKLVQEFRNLVQRRGVDAVVGFTSSGSCVAIAPVAEELKMLTVMFDCGTPRIFEEAKYDYVFRPSAHGTMTATGAAFYVNEVFPNAKSISGINQNYAWGQDSWRDFKLAMATIKPETKVKTELLPKLFQGQYASEISKLLNDKPDVVFSSMWGGDLEAFMVQSTARGLTKRSKLILTVAEIIMYRLQDKVPEGAIVGGRAAYGVMARDTELNRWLRKTYTERYERQPTYPVYEMAQSLLFLKIAADKAQKANGGKSPTMDQIREHMVGLEFEAFGTTVKMALGGGHQAISEAAYGQFHRDPKTGPTLTNIRYYPAECVLPPDGMKAEDWLKKGMPGAEACKK